MPRVIGIAKASLSEFNEKTKACSNFQVAAMLQNGTAVWLLRDRSWWRLGCTSSR